MKEPKPSTIKRLFAISGNQCAFPECDLPIVEDSGTVTGIVCHIKARNRGGPRFDSKQSDEERHSFENLILLCARHSKVIDSEPKRFTVDALVSIKQLHEGIAGNGLVELSRSDSIKAQSLIENYRFIYIQSGSNVRIENADTIRADTVNFGGKGTPIISAPDGAIGASLRHRNYTKHLIERYQDFASNQPDRSFKFPAIYSNLKKKFGAKWELIPLEYFDEVTRYLQSRIDRTRLGKINLSKEIPNYSSFAEFARKHRW